MQFLKHVLRTDVVLRKCYVVLLRHYIGALASPIICRPRRQTSDR